VAIFTTNVSFDFYEKKYIREKLKNNLEILDIIIWWDIKKFKKYNLVKNTKKKTIIIMELLWMNLAFDHLNKEKILFVRSKTIKIRCSLGLLRENLTGNGNHRLKCQKYSLFSLKNA